MIARSKAFYLSLALTFLPLASVQGATAQTGKGAVSEHKDQTNAVKASKQTEPAKKAETRPTEVKKIDTKNDVKKTETKTVESKVDAMKAAPAAKSGDVKKADAKPATETKSGDVKKADAKPAAEAKSGDVKKPEAKSSDTKKTETKTAVRPARHEQMMVPPPPPNTPTIIPDSYDGLMPVEFMTKELAGQRRKELALQLDNAKADLKAKQQDADDKKAKALQFESLYKEGVISRKELESAQQDADHIDSDMARDQTKVKMLQQMLSSLDSKLKPTRSTTKTVKGKSAHDSKISLKGAANPQSAKDAAAKSVPMTKEETQARAEANSFFANKPESSTDKPAVSVPAESPVDGAPGNNATSRDSVKSPANTGPAVDPKHGDIKPDAGPRAAEPASKAADAGPAAKKVKPAAKTSVSTKTTAKSSNINSK